jgi:hypothetical protein
MEWPTFNFGYFIKPFDQGGNKRIIEARVGAQRSMNIAAHRIDVSLDGEQSGVMSPTRDLLNKNRKGEGLGRCEILVVVLLTNARLPVFV